MPLPLPTKTTTMLPHHRRRLDFAAGNHFSFCSLASEHNEYGAWVENLKTLDNSFGKRDPHRKVGPWVRTTRLSGESDSNTFSPPLWKSASPDISRAQMIDNYRQEMMDLVRNLPETSYELSLRDIVESPARHRREKAAEEQDEKEAVITESWDKKKGRGKRRERRGKKSGVNISGWFLLKLFMPNVPTVVSCNRRESTCAGSKISARLIPAVPAVGEWANEEFRERSSSNGSSNNGCSCRGRLRWKLGTCCSFF